MWAHRIKMFSVDIPLLLYTYLCCKYKIKLLYIWPLFLRKFLCAIDEFIVFFFLSCEVMYKTKNLPTVTAESFVPPIKDVENNFYFCAIHVAR